MRLLIALLAMFGLPACTGMLLGSGTGGEVAPTSRPAGTGTATDSNISGSLRQQYSADGEISRFPIGIRAIGGRVVLTGTVGSYDIRDRVVDIAQNTRGVVSVDSRIVVNTNR